jgi:hypothetical protein
MSKDRNEGIRPASRYPTYAPLAELKGVLAEMPWAVALFDRQWRFIFATSIFTEVFELLGHRPVEGKAVIDLIPDAPVDFLKEVGMAALSGEVRMDQPYDWYRDSGQVWQCLYSVYPWQYGSQRGIIAECRSSVVNGIERIVNAMGGGDIPRLRRREPLVLHRSGLAEEEPPGTWDMHAYLGDLVDARVEENLARSVLLAGGEVTFTITEMLKTMAGEPCRVKHVAVISRLGEETTSPPAGSSSGNGPR